MASVIGELRAVHRQAVEREDPWAAGDLGRWLWRAGDLHRLDDVAARPYALQVKGDWQGAMRAWQRHGVPYEAALCLADSPDPVDLTEAHSRLVGLGAEAVARHVAVTIRGLGASVPRGPRRSTRANQSGLTTREAEIAGLAAAGLTNREIADQLVLTQKTVSHHISAVLGKLGARRRADIAQLLTRSPAPH
jgi:DNA-binding CsgD family transcriptional regulator